MTTLKPCPFCGGEAELRDGNIYMTATKIITCKRCHVRTLPVQIDCPSMTDSGIDESTRYTAEQAEQKAIELWNRRC